MRAEPTAFDRRAALGPARREAARCIAFLRYNTLVRHSTSSSKKIEGWLAVLVPRGPRREYIVVSRGLSVAILISLTAAISACHRSDAIRTGSNVPIAGISTATPQAAMGLLDRLLDLETPKSDDRDAVRAWVAKAAQRVRDAPSPAGPDTDRLERDAVNSRMLDWLRGLPPSTRTEDWRLTTLARTKPGSCLALVTAAVLVGRSAGLHVDPVAVPDHLLLRLGDGKNARLLELIEGASTVPLREARIRYRVPAPPADAFLRALTNDELVACFPIIRPATTTWAWLNLHWGT